MLKEYVRELLGVLHEPVTTEKIGDLLYKVVPGEHGPMLGGVIEPPASPTLGLRTLTGFVDAVHAGIDEFGSDAAVCVEDHRTVALLSMRADVYGRREAWLRATCKEENPFKFGEHQTPEQFIIALQSSFLPTENILKLQKLCSSLSTENSVQTADDGLAQVITVKQGTVTRTHVELPPRIPLVPWRSFREAAPAETEFLLRLKGKPGEVPAVALLEIDGGKWKLDTMLSIAKYLRDALPKLTVIA